MGNVFMGMHFIFVYERLVFGLYDHDIASYIPNPTQHCLLLTKYTYLKFNTLSQVANIYPCVCTCLHMSIYVCTLVYVCTLGSHKYVV